MNVALGFITNLCCFALPFGIWFMWMSKHNKEVMQSGRKEELFFLGLAMFLVALCWLVAYYSQKNGCTL